MSFMGEKKNKKHLRQLGPNNFDTLHFPWNFKYFVMPRWIYSHLLPRLSWCTFEELWVDRHVFKFIFKSKVYVILTWSVACAWAASLKFPCTHPAEAQALVLILTLDHSFRWFISFSLRKLSAVSMGFALWDS